MRRETSSPHGLSSPFTPLEVQPPISCDDDASTSKRPSSKVSLNHLKSNIIGDMEKGFRQRRGTINHVTYHCYLVQFKPKKVEEALQDKNTPCIKNYINV